MKRSEQVGRALSHQLVGAQIQSAPLSHHFSLEHFSTLSLVVLLTLGVCQAPSSISCLEDDATIMAPVAELAKGIIKTVTLGVPLELNLNTSGLVKNFAYFTWRTGFPMSMPSGVMQKAQDFYNQVRARVERVPVQSVQRKPLIGLRDDLDAIVDGMVEQVRRSPDGLYTDYLQSFVGNASLPLEEACTQVGIQLKAYGVDLTNYRDIAGAVLGIPLMPTVASTMMNVASMGQTGFGIVQNLTSTAIVQPLNMTTNLLLSQVPLMPIASNLANAGQQVIPFGRMLLGNRRVA